jgi:hypothetical protein
VSVEVSAPMPGTISEVLVSVGDEVKFDRSSFLRRWPVNYKGTVKHKGCILMPG